MRNLGNTQRMHQQSLADFECPGLVLWRRDVIAPALLNSQVNLMRTTDRIQSRAADNTSLGLSPEFRSCRTGVGSFGLVLCSDPPFSAP